MNFRVIRIMLNFLTQPDYPAVQRGKIISRKNVLMRKARVKDYPSISLKLVKFLKWKSLNSNILNFFFFIYKIT